MPSCLNGQLHCTGNLKGHHASKKQQSLSIYFSLQIKPIPSQSSSPALSLSLLLPLSYYPSLPLSLSLSPATSLSLTTSLSLSVFSATPLSHLLPLSLSLSLTTSLSLSLATTLSCYPSGGFSEGGGFLSKNSLAMTDFHAKKTQHVQLFENPLPGTPPFAIPKKARKLPEKTRICFPWRTPEALEKERKSVKKEPCKRKKALGNGPNTVPETTVSSTELSDFCLRSPSCGGRTQ